MRNRILFTVLLIIVLVWVAWPGGKGVPRNPEKEIASDFTRQEQRSGGYDSPSNAPPLSSPQRRPELELGAGSDEHLDLTSQEDPPPPEQALEAGETYGLDVPSDGNEHSATGLPEEEIEQNPGLMAREETPPPEQAFEAGETYGLDIPFDDNEHSATSLSEEEIEQPPGPSLQDGSPPADKSLEAGRVYPLNRPRQ